MRDQKILHTIHLITLLQMDKKYQIAVFYYTQTGQTLAILKSLLTPLQSQGCQVIYKSIEPKIPFPYPWDKESFYQAFPESRQGIPCDLKPIDYSDIKDADLVVIGLQAWFLSPSLPIASFLQHPDAIEYLNGKMVITVVGSRNMWVSCHDALSYYFMKTNSNWIGNITLEDRHNNLVSVLTIFRWLIGGVKEKTRFLPSAGVSQEDIDKVSSLAPDILKTLTDKDYDSLQQRIVEKGGVVFHYDLYQIEKVGYKMFGFWSKYVLRKGSFNSPDRSWRWKLFSWYLMFVLFVLSPIAIAVFWLLFPLRKKSLSRIKKKYLYLCD